MSTVLVSDLVTAIRLTSGLRQNPLFSDTEIASFVDDAAHEYYDVFVASLQHWFRKTITFTLTGGEGGNTFDLSTVPDFMMDQGLNYLTNNGRPRTVTRLGSFAERNSNTGPFPLGGCDLQYFTDGDLLTVTPAGSAAGTYELVYTKQIERLALPVSTTVNVAAGDDCFPSAGLLTFTLANLTFDPTYVGGTLTTNFGLSSGNVALNGNYTIATSPPGAHYCITTIVDTGQTMHLPNSGTATATYQPAGTRGDIPQILCPWVEFLKVHASVALNTSRGYPCEDLKQKLETQRRRITSMAKMRSEGVSQAPITRRRVRMGGWVY